MSDPSTHAAGSSPTLRGHDVLVVGGGPRALGVVGRLLRAEAEVTVVAPTLVTALEDLVSRGLLAWIDRDLDRSDLAGIAVVAPATGSAEADGEVIRTAASLGVPVLASTFEDVHPDGAREASPVAPGSVVLVGGGPGAPGLITVAGREAVLGADVVVVDRLAPLALLDELGPEVEVVDVSKIPRGRFTPQEEINAVLVDRARAGRRVVRLKGGDPFVFGRGKEEAMACEEAGIPVEVIPGVTSAVSAPELAGIPVTHRGTVQGFAVISGHAAPDDPRSTVDWAALAASGVTIVVLMGVETLPRIARTLLAAGRDADTPVASIMDAAMPSQRHVVSTLGSIADGVPEGIVPPAVTVIGDVASFGAAG